MKNNKQYIVWVIAIIILAGLVILAVRGSRAAAAPYHELAQCITESGATFYGAWWCPACAEQKEIFKGGKSSLPYTECSTPTREMNEVCLAAEIESYPTWEFADGSRLSGAIEPSELAERSGCELPAQLKTGNETSADNTTVGEVIGTETNL